MKGILFQEDLFAEAVDGSKTQTRRLVQDVKYKGERVNLALCGELIGRGITDCTTFYGADRRIYSIYPRYRTGEVVYLKEPYFPFPNTSSIAYQFDNPGVFFVGGWKNKLFMPADCARYFIKITRVRCERVMEITADDVQAEGVDYLKKLPVLLPKKLTEQQLHELATTIARHEYGQLWNRINVRYNRDRSDYRGYLFEDNPYVWVYDFELTEKPE